MTKPESNHLRRRLPLIAGTIAVVALLLAAASVTVVATPRDVTDKPASTEPLARSGIPDLTQFRNDQSTKGDSACPGDTECEDRDGHAVHASPEAP